MARWTITAYLILVCSIDAIASTGPLAVIAQPENIRRDVRTGVDKRQGVTSRLITCGFADGDPSKPRTANLGFDCRIDTAHGIWGFCPTTVNAATDCGLAAACQDSNTCSGVCGYTDNTDLTTFICQSSPLNQAYCSTAMLTFGVDQTYAYIACGAGPVTDHLLISPTTASSSPATSTVTSSSLKTSSSRTSTLSSASSTPPRTKSMPTAAAATASSTPPISSSSSSPNNTGAVIGGVIGGLAVVCGSAIAVTYLLRRGQKSKRNGASRSPSPRGPPDSETLFMVESSIKHQAPAELPARNSYLRAPVELPSHSDR